MSPLTIVLELLTLFFTIKNDEVEVKVKKNLCKLAFAFPCIIYFRIFFLPPTKKKIKYRIFATFKGT
jgi:hypothetical protein